MHVYGSDPLDAIIWYKLILNGKWIAAIVDLSYKKLIIGKTLLLVTIDFVPDTLVVKRGLDGMTLL